MHIVYTRENIGVFSVYIRYARRVLANAHTHTHKIQKKNETQCLYAEQEPNTQITACIYSNRI